jgi:acyl-CoA thioesterase-2
LSKTLQELIDHLTLTPLEEDRFLGQSQDLGWGTVFGGQILGQALAAAEQTVLGDRPVHSLHAYFLRVGAVDQPVEYGVDRIRDGRSFTTRRVVAFQGNRPIFNLSASFHKNEHGFDHQSEMPDALPPERLISETDLARAVADLVPEKLKSRALSPRPIEARPVDPVNPFNPEKRSAKRMVWYRAAGELPDETHLHRYLLAYASDFNFLTTALQPHALSWLSPGIRMASLDHAMWFHRPFRMDEWLLHVIEGPSASGGRALVRGQFFTRDGRLVASTAQEGVIRMKDWQV